MVNSHLCSEQVNRGCVIWQGNNIFLTPVHNWIHYCIQEWSWKWDVALMTSTVQPNRRQNIITMLGGGTVGRFCEPIWVRGLKVENPSLASKGAGPRGVSFPIFGGWRSDRIPFFSGLTIIGLRAPKYRLFLVSSLLRISLTTSWSPI